MSSDTDSQPHFKFYHYDPSFAGALVFTILFGVANVWHLALIAKHRTWYFIPVVVGGIFKNSVYYDLSTSADVECEVEIVGYAARAWSNKQAPNPTIGPYVVQTLLILVAPALFAASIYMVLGRIVISVDGESYSLIKKKWLTKVFVTSDVISFFIQLGGGGLMASSDASTSNLGSHIILAGLLIQILIFGFFVSVSVVFQRRMSVILTSRSYNRSLPWKKYLYILYITCGFIMFRSIVRVAEFVEGFEGEILTHEVFLFIFDAVPMLAVMVIFNFWYPSNFSERERKALLGRECVESSVELSNADVPDLKVESKNHE